MKKYLMGAALCAVMFGTSCQNESIVQQSTSNEFSLTLDMGAESRTMMGENGCQWGDSESLYVVGDGGNVYGTLTMVWKSADSKSAMFSGKINGDASRLEHMVYPVPNEEGQIPMNTLNGANHNAPMVGSIANGEVTDLGYVGGLVKVEVNGEVGENKVTLEAVEGDNANAGTSVVAGYYQFDPTSGTLEYKQYEDGEGENGTVTVTNIPENGIIYLPVDTDGTKDDTETITVSLTIGDNDPVVAQVEVAQNAATVSGENSFPVVNYDATEGVVSSKIANLDELKKAVKVGGEYELVADELVTDEKLLVKKDIIISGTGTQVVKGNKQNDVFRIEASGSFEFRDFTIVNEYTGGRCINTRYGDTELIIDGMTLQRTGNGNGGALQIAGSGNNIEVSVKRSFIHAGRAGYAVLTFNPVNMTIDGSELEGYSVLYMKGKDESLGSAGSVFKIENSILHSHDVKGGGESNNFSTIVFEDGGIEILVSGEKSKIMAECIDANHVHSVFGIQGAEELSGINVDIKPEATLEAGTLITLAGGQKNGLGDNTIKIPSKHKSFVDNEAYAISEEVDGQVTILDKVEEQESDK